MPNDLLEPRPEDDSTDRVRDPDKIYCETCDEIIEDEDADVVEKVGLSRKVTFYHGECCRG